MSTDAGQKMVDLSDELDEFLGEDQVNEGSGETGETGETGDEPKGGPYEPKTPPPGSAN